MHLAIDFDDVILDFLGGVLGGTYKETGVLIEPKDVHGWHYGQYGLDEALGEDWWKWLEKRNWLWGNFKPILGAIRGVERLQEAGHFVEILTVKPKWATPQLWKWLGRWQMRPNQVTIVPHKDDQGGVSSPKVEYSTAPILIDDGPHNIEEWEARDTWVQPRRGILFDRPWNRDYFPHYRVLNWKSLLDKIEEMNHAGI